MKKMLKVIFKMEKRSRNRLLIFLALTGISFFGLLAYGAWYSVSYFKNTNFQDSFSFESSRCLDHTKDLVLTTLTLDPVVIIPKSKLALNTCFNLDERTKEILNTL